VRNGLLLCIPFEAAFDALQLCIVPRSSMSSAGVEHVVHVLDPQLINTELASKLPAPPQVNQMLHHLVYINLFTFYSIA
jgi:hypothetical protein